MNLYFKDGLLMERIFEGLFKGLVSFFPIPYVFGNIFSSSTNLSKKLTTKQPNPNPKVTNHYAIVSP
jgi:hypothetical protein